ncbi:hypothetical protein GGI21_003387 [Coemansia aciculifera]|uniref:Uncharacterized protein n=1 Tax=Coemansia aciculifera TaxID=417176 RepID=A0ACC1LWS8_9FUNG|nr:hypothetical protein IWW38_004985 [Coemansia aciculifera]KAJ2907936.1 hypothetical protein GGI21_003387 [Coemansia aciculifera]
MTSTTKLVAGHLPLSKIGLGCGVFSGAYGPAPPQASAVATVRAALSSGINIVDTSPYYGDSEIKLGQALFELKDEYPRSSYHICTKVGRYGYCKSDFDYSAERISESVRESMRRLYTDYLDIVLCHDVEFVSADQVVDVALPMLFDLKQQGLVRKVGISGYPLPVMLRICQIQQERGVPLDVCLSYCNLNLHCQSLAAFVPKLREAGVETIIAASPLSMGLLCQSEAPEWHPAKPQLKAAVKQCAELVERFSQSYGNAETGGSSVSLAEIAENYAFSYNKVDVHLVGAKTVQEIEHAVRAYDRAQQLQLYASGRYANPRIQHLYSQIKATLEPFAHYTWTSPPDDA